MRLFTLSFKTHFGFKKSTNLSTLYGELGRIPLLFIRKINMIKYWIKILKQNDTALLRRSYWILKVDADRNLKYNGENWAFQIKIFCKNMVYCMYGMINLKSIFLFH